MTIKKDTYVTSATVAANKRVHATNNKVVALGPSVGKETLERLTPLAFDEVNGYYRPWRAPVNEVQTVTIDATGGTFDLSFGAETLADLAWNVAAATLQAALEALPEIGYGNVTVSLAALVYTITFKARKAHTKMPLFVSDATNLTGGGGTATVARVTAGVDDKTYEIVGFTWPNEVTLDDADEVLIEMMTRGRINAEDVALPDGEDQDELDAALRGDLPYRSLGAIGIDVEGLADVH